MKKTAILLLFVMSLAFLFSCGGDTAEGENMENNEESGEQTAPSLSYKDDMSEYITLEAKDRPFSVEIPFAAPGDFELNEKIVKLLYENRGEVQHEGLNQKDVTVKAGDAVNMYYRGYTVEEGRAVYFDGGCNFLSGEAQLGIGSGKFISGFESGLVGKNSKDYVSLTTLTDGEVANGDIVLFSYTAVKGTGKSTGSAYISLSEGSEVFGEELCAAFVGAKIGDTLDGEFAVGEGEGLVTYTGVKVTKILRPCLTDEDGRELPVLVVDAYFPEGYQEPSLAGKWSKFEVYIMTVQVYDAPALDDAFVTETLKIDADTLDKYEGDTPSEKYKKMLYAQLMSEHNAKVEEFALSEMWAIYLERAKVKKLPEEVIAATYDSLLADMQSYYSYYAAYFRSFEDFAALWLQLDSDDEWETVLAELARDTVLREALLYYLLTEEGMMPDDMELTIESEAARVELFGEYLRQSGITREKYDSDEKYTAAVTSAEEQFDSMYPDGYFERAYLLTFESKLLEKYGDVK